MSAAATSAGVRFDGRVALVTGASSGLGRAIALALGAEGAAVGAMGRDAATLADTVGAIEAAGGRALALAGDVRSGAAVEDAVARVVEAFGGLDAVAHAAGVNRGGDAQELSEDEWDELLETNLKSCFLLAKHAVPAIRAGGRGGAVVNVSSIFAQAAIPGAGAYAASKAGVEALTKVMALDHAAEGIRFNVVAPGSMRTPMVERELARLAPAEAEALLAGVERAYPIGRLVTVEEVAATVLFLLSDAATGITGVCVVVDGGRLARVGDPDPTTDEGAP
ncbi:MAG TPA: SDR family NAD(P)-dependent oxidoreductase [Conexibacter sp.]|nr:SDR family NAD(P)-dependent oxidoreductase [Conexibacter sp.]